MTMSENVIDEEKFLAAKAQAIVELRKKFFEAGNPFVLPRQEFDNNWKFADNIWCLKHSPEHRNHGTVHFSYRCPLNQARNKKIQESKPAGYMNPSGRNLTVQKDIECTAHLCVDMNDSEVKIHVKIGHNHGLCDSDCYKKSSHLKNTVQEFGRQGFKAGTIKSVLVDKARSKEEAQATGMDKVTTKDVCNWLRGVTPDSSTDFGCTSSKQHLTEMMLHMDMADARLFLTNNGYKHQLKRCAVSKDGKTRWVLIFATEEQLEALAKLWLCLSI